jgi:hypothetical protein
MVIMNNGIVMHFSGEEQTARCTESIEEKIHCTLKLGSWTNSGMHYIYPYSNCLYVTANQIKLKVDTDVDISTLFENIDYPLISVKAEHHAKRWEINE